MSNREWETENWKPGNDASASTMTGLTFPIFHFRFDIASCLLAQHRQVPPQRRLACAQRSRALPLLVDDLGRRAVDEVGAAQLRVDPGQLLLDLRQVALEPLA